MFLSTKIRLIYGAAGTGKTTLINYVSFLMKDKQKLFIAICSKIKLLFFISLVSFQRSIKFLFSLLNGSVSSLITLSSNTFLQRLNQLKLFIAKTNPAVNNLRRKINDDGNSDYMTIDKFINQFIASNSPTLYKYFL